MHVLLNQDPVSSTQCEFKARFPDIVSRSCEVFTIKRTVPFTYALIGRLAVREEQVTANQIGRPISHEEFLHSITRIVPVGFDVDRILKIACIHSEKCLVKLHGRLGSRMAIRVIFLTCVVISVKLVSDRECLGLLQKASRIVAVGSVTQPHFRLTVSELARIETWILCDVLQFSLISI